jgi:hypothetical protein
MENGAANGVMRENLRANVRVQMGPKRFAPLAVHDTALATKGHPSGMKTDFSCAAIAARHLKQIGDLVPIDVDVQVAIGNAHGVDVARKKPTGRVPVQTGKRHSVPHAAAGIVPATRR